MFNKVLLLINLLTAKHVPIDLLQDFIAGLFPVIVRKNKRHMIQVSAGEFVPLEEYCYDNITITEIFSDNICNQISNESFAVFSSEELVEWSRSKHVERLAINNNDTISFYNIRMKKFGVSYQLQAIQEFAEQVAKKTRNIFYEYEFNTRDPIEWKGIPSPCVWDNTQDVGSYAYVSGNVEIFRGYNTGINKDVGLKLCLRYYVFKIKISADSRVSDEQMRD
jgi:hypothetical protein